LAPRACPLFSLIEVEERPGDEKAIVSKRRAEKREIRCEVMIPPTLVGVKVNVTPSLMRFAFENVIDNAIDATENFTDGYLAISAAEGPSPNFVQVTFSNNGERIDQGTLNAVNQNNFKELKQSWGLMIAKCFAVCHGGGLVISWPPEGGTASTFTLPVAE
jgi:signal transduction histidine kinase